MSKYKGKTIYVDGNSFLLGEQLGSGGNGYVCSAKSIGIEMSCAVKFLNISEDDENYSIKKERFLREIEYCKKVDSEYIIKVLGHGVFEEKIYYVMPEYAKTLRKVISEEYAPFVLLNYCVELCAALKYIHAQGVIHRDIKPENIFISETGKLVLADFGIAHFFDSTLTKANDWLGNKNYAAPEQLIKGNSNDVTVACDIYALGAVINEIFTKQKPDGTKFQSISNKYPYLSKLDGIVYRCLLQDPIERPSITTVYNEIKLLSEEVKSLAEDIQDFLWPIKAVEFKNEEIESIILKATFDLLSANYLFHEKTTDELEIYNPNYHQTICYDIDAFLKNVYFQHYLLQKCENKFAYEANMYSKGKPYHPLNFKKKQDRNIYDHFESLLKNSAIASRQFDLSGQILKTFSSCCDYHCKELINAAISAKRMAEELDHSPILYVVLRLKSVLSEDASRAIRLEDHLSINWERTYIGEDDSQLIMEESGDEKKSVLEKLQAEWDISFGKRDKMHYSVTFSSREEYTKFKKFALEFSKSDYVFEGDVLDILVVEREYGGLVELKPLNEFDINFVLARLLGLIADY